MSRRPRHRLHANPFNVRGAVSVPDWRATYGRTAPFALDVGFGDGRFTLALARSHPEWNVLGLEIRQHLVDDLLQRARTAAVANVWAMLANANTHLGELVGARSVVFVAVNFPDPWFKKRHQKRRVVSAAWLAALAPKLADGAEVHVMTDFAPVGHEALRVLGAAPGFENRSDTGGFSAESTTGLQSERELTHMKRGEPIYRLHFRYSAPRPDPQPAAAVVPDTGRRYDENG
ncbi:MAG: tRNA (guanosine(46)-N7)-methyltransferase TrmB [Deltaproteobacteria bacterium]|nr:tRNA (guanosine(46)-N7)-methyltransferase TrmB [Deltaproteobacteria bacterium]